MLFNYMVEFYFFTERIAGLKRLKLVGAGEFHPVLKTTGNPWSKGFPSQLI